jgi:hypothetical protein
MSPATSDHATARLHSVQVPSLFAVISPGCEGEKSHCATRSSAAMPSVSLNHRSHFSGARSTRTRRTRGSQKAQLAPPPLPPSDEPRTWSASPRDRQKKTAPRTQTDLMQQRRILHSELPGCTLHAATTTTPPPSSCRQNMLNLRGGGQPRARHVADRETDGRGGVMVTHGPCDMGCSGTELSPTEPECALEH